MTGIRRRLVDSKVLQVIPWQDAKTLDVDGNEQAGPSVHPEIEGGELAQHCRHDNPVGNHIGRSGPTMGRSNRAWSVSWSTACAGMGAIRLTATKASRAKPMVVLYMAEFLGDNLGPLLT